MPGWMLVIVACAAAIAYIVSRNAPDSPAGRRTHEGPGGDMYRRPSAPPPPGRFDLLSPLSPPVRPSPQAILALERQPGAEEDDEQRAAAGFPGPADPADAGDPGAAGSASGAFGGGESMTRDPVGDGRVLRAVFPISDGPQHAGVDIGGPATRDGFGESGIKRFARGVFGRAPMDPADAAALESLRQDRMALRERAEEQLAHEERLRYDELRLEEERERDRLLYEERLHLDDEWRRSSTYGYS